MTEQTEQTEHPGQSEQTARPTVTEAMFSLTGFDEIAIARSFGKDLGTLRSEPFQLMRALAFVEARRGAMRDDDAYRYAMGLSIAVVSAMYPDPDPDQVTELAEDTDPGKAP